MEYICSEVGRPLLLLYFESESSSRDGLLRETVRATLVSVRPIFQYTRMSDLASSEVCCLHLHVREQFLGRSPLLFQKTYSKAVVVVAHAVDEKREGHWRVPEGRTNVFPVLLYLRLHGEL